MLTAIIAWFSGSKFARYLAELAAGVTLIGVTVWRIFAAGENKQRSKETDGSLDVLRSREKTDEKISSMPVSDLDKQLGEWVHDDPPGKQ